VKQTCEVTKVLEKYTTEGMKCVFKDFYIKKLLEYNTNNKGEK